jgi:hypothetical protein
MSLSRVTPINSNNKPVVKLRKMTLKMLQITAIRTKIKDWDRMRDGLQCLRTTRKLKIRLKTTLTTNKGGLLPKTTSSRWLKFTQSSFSLTKTSSKSRRTKQPLSHNTKTHRPNHKASSKSL